MYICYLKQLAVIDCVSVLYSYRSLQESHQLLHMAEIVCRESFVMFVIRMTKVFIHSSTGFEWITNAP